MEVAKRTATEKLIVFLAEGFGVGRIPFLPGTFGTGIGLIWIYLLLLPRNVPLYIAGIIFGFFAAVYIGERAEHILQMKDPNRIVIDEIVAMPLAFLPAVLMTKADALILHPSAFLSKKLIILPLIAFFVFRVFDIIKPLGIARIQKAPGGWGLVLDDYLAALATAVVLALFILSSS